ncbi:MAG: hypothetical protein JO263_04555, partial [Candidatus Eremiobacteraeota bacterium]|nr:hypothetical protein [Candidatus Eremiobacteraeota bacterium]
MPHTFKFRWFLLTATLALAACGGGGNAVFAPARTGASPQRAMRLARFASDPSKGKIKQIIIVVQENRSFNDLFKGFKGATTSSYGYDSKGNKITLLPVGLETKWDIDHSSNAFFEACDGTGSIPGTNCRMDGFDKEWVGCGA